MIAGVPVGSSLPTLDREGVKDWVLRVYCVGHKVCAKGFSNHRLHRLALLAGPLTKQVVLTLRDNGLDERH